jgi:hypothetical protein
MNELASSTSHGGSGLPSSPRKHRRVPGGSLTLITGASVLVIAGLLTGAAGALGATSAPAAVKPPPKLSHQLCYTSTAKGFLKIPKPGTVRLINRFSPNGFLPKVGPAVLNCNPVKKILPTGAVFPITYPAGHLACFGISGFPAQPAPATTVVNQFGTATLLLRQPKLLCLPTWKSLTGPPKAPTVQPPYLDHFTCYPIVATRGKFMPPAVMLQDEFTSKPVSVDVKAVPTQFCLPTVKIIGKLPPNPIVHPHGSLVCFPVGQTPIKPTVWDLNQFGRAVVTIHKTALLCLPSKIVPSTTG